MTPPVVAEYAEVRLETTATLNAGQLHVKYEVHNNGQTAIYIFNRLYSKIDRNGVWQTDTNRVYVLPSSDGIILAKKVIPLPANLDVEKPEVPCVTRVAPGETLRESLVVTLPVKISTPYTKVKASIVRIVQSSFSFEVGFFNEKPGTAQLAKEVKTPRGHALYFAPFNSDKQSVLRTGPFPFRIPAELPSQ